MTKRVPLTVRFAGSITDSWGKTRAAFHASGTVTRSDFGLVAGLNEEAGGMLLGTTSPLTSRPRRASRSAPRSSVRSDTQISDKHSPLHPER